MPRLKRHVRNYTQVGNDIINAKNLSLKAKGLFLFLLSKPDNWNFSARLIATQNKDAIASVNSGLQELEDFGLLHRVPVQGGYDYDIFDTVQSHLVENRLSGKSVKRQSKIHLVENQPSISNKEFQVREIKREIVNTILDERSFPYLSLFLDSVCSSRSVRNKIAYRSFVRSSLLDSSSEKHGVTLDAYLDYSQNFSLSSIKKIPDGFSAFDIYENMEVKHV